VPGVALCIAAGHADPEQPKIEVPIAAIQLQPNAVLDLAALSAAVATLPEYGRPRRIRVVTNLPMTDGFRPIKRSIRDLDVSDGANVYSWNPHAQNYIATEGSARSAREA